MRRFERRHVGAIPAGGTFHRLAARRIERHGPNVEVAGETPVEPTILIAPWRNTSAVGFDPTGPRGIRPCSPTQRQPSQKRFSADASPAMGTFPGRLTGQALPGLFAKEIVPQCVVWGASPQPSTIFSSPA
jgi:hypothetical protein